VPTKTNDVGILHKGFCSKEQPPKIIDYEPLRRKMWQCPECKRMITWMDPNIFKKFGN